MDDRARLGSRVRAATANRGSWRLKTTTDRLWDAACQGPVANEQALWRAVPVTCSHGNPARSINATYTELAQYLARRTRCR